MISSLDPQLFAAPVLPRFERWSLLALIVDTGAVERTHDAVLSFPLDSSRSGVLVREASFLDRGHIRTCYSARCDAPSDSQFCTERALDKPLVHKVPYFQFEGRGNPVTTPFKQTCIVYGIPVRTPGSGTAHVVRVIDQWPLRIRIRQASGIESDGQLPNVEIRLPDSHEASGFLEVEVYGYGLGPEVGIFVEPPVLEVSSMNEHLLDPLRARAASLW